MSIDGKLEIETVRENNRKMQIEAIQRMLNATRNIK